MVVRNECDTFCGSFGKVKLLPIPCHLPHIRGAVLRLVCTHTPRIGGGLDIDVIIDADAVD